MGIEAQSIDNSPDRINVAVLNDIALIAVRGRASFRNGEALKKFAGKAISLGCDTFIFDLHGCVNMDSTFMGVVAGVAMRLETEMGGKVFAINLTPKTHSLLDTLGLGNIISMHMEGDVPEEVKQATAGEAGMKALAAESEGKKFTLEMMLDAHKDLVRASEQNMPKFRDVMTYLAEELDSYRGN